MMKTRKHINLVVTVVIAVMAIALFMGGIALTTRYKETIVNTYQKYYDRYYDRAKGYYDTLKERIEKDIELARQDKK
ncbi:MAG: hypothetical protein IJV39_06525 [Ruminococcus sp.]|nr:hypothetical protein [Ruminococcus sp.]